MRGWVEWRMNQQSGTGKSQLLQCVGAPFDPVVASLAFLLLVSQITISLYGLYGGGGDSREPMPTTH